MLLSTLNPRACWLAFMQVIMGYINAQNLVLNPSFEQHTQCPVASSQIGYCNNWHNANGTCDYYSALGCAGSHAPPIIKPGSGLTWFQQPLSGKSFAGFIPYYNSSSNISYLEFLQGEFSSALISNKLYYVEFYVNSASQIKYFLHDIAALITDTAGNINVMNIQTYTPQILPMPNKIYNDTTNWMRINGYYTAHGGENYITIGNYSPFGQELKDSVANYAPSLASGVYYFIDSVGVYEITHLDIWDAGPDKFINYGDSVQIGNPNTDLSMFSWETSVGGITYLSDSTEANPWSKPSITTKYVVAKTQGSNIFNDTVTVFVTGGANIQHIESNNMKINIFPNPNNGIMQINYSSKQNADLEILDINGNLVSTYNLKEDENRLSISNDILYNGVYFYRIVKNNIPYKCQKLVIIK